jgi:hypothetical protein
MSFALLELTAMMLQPSCSGAAAALQQGCKGLRNGLNFKMSRLNQNV